MYVLLHEQQMSLGSDKEQMLNSFGWHFVCVAGSRVARRVRSLGSEQEAQVRSQHHVQVDPMRWPS